MDVFKQLFRVIIRFVNSNFTASQPIAMITSNLHNMNYMPYYQLFNYLFMGLAESYLRPLDDSPRPMVLRLPYQHFVMPLYHRAR